MASTLGQLRARVYSLLDDDGTRWTEEEVDTALAIALDGAVISYSNTGGSLLDQVVESTVTGGTLDLSTYKPVKIKAAAIKLGNSYYRLPQASFGAVTGPVVSNYTVRIKLVARPSLPKDAADEVVYGKDNTIPFPAMDQLICVKAAQLLSVKDLPEGAVDNGLLMQEQMLWNEVKNADAGPAVYDMGGALYFGRSAISHYRMYGGTLISYLYTPYTIQLVDC